MKRILILGAPIFQIPIIQKAKEMGLYVGIVDINKDAPAFPYADEKFICSIRDIDEVIKIAKEFKPDGIVMGACDTSVVTGAYICKALNLQGHSIETAVKSTDKVKMLEAFELKNVPHPFFKVVRKEDIGNIDSKLPYPVISKPTDSAGGRGIRIIHTKDELKASILFSSNSGLSGDVLIEEYMYGPEVSVEILVIDGVPHVLQITDKITSGEPNFYEIGHSQPSVLSNSIKEEIEKVAKAAVGAVGIKNSPAHVEIIVTNNGPKMVELGARLGGDCITTYLLDNSVKGINMAQSAIELALGIKPDINHYDNSGICSAVRFIPAKRGTLKAIHGIKDIKNTNDVVKIEITGIIDKCYDDATDDTARFGYVVCKGNTTKEALEKCQNVINMLKFELV